MRKCGRLRRCLASLLRFTIVLSVSRPILEGLSVIFFV